MGKNLLSIDWDYFIPIKESWNGSYIENRSNIMFVWYKRYFQNKKNGINIEKKIRAGRELDDFLKNIKKRFIFRSNTKMYVSDSHKFSYYIAKNNDCSRVINIDAHSDLGYGGLRSLYFELNCANWLGKLLKNKIIGSADIVYSPYTYETEHDFQEINRKFNIAYISIEDIFQLPVNFIHICRSGSWTPPWLDNKFHNFVKSFNIPYRKVQYERRSWNPEGLNLADRINISL